MELKKTSTKKLTAKQKSDFASLLYSGKKLNQIKRTLKEHPSLINTEISKEFSFRAGTPLEHVYYFYSGSIGEENHVRQLATLLVESKANVTPKLYDSVRHNALYQQKNVRTLNSIILGKNLLY